MKGTSCSGSGVVAEAADSVTDIFFFLMNGESWKCSSSSNSLAREARSESSENEYLCSLDFFGLFSTLSCCPFSFCVASFCFFFKVFK